MWCWKRNRTIASGVAFGLAMLTRPIVLPMLLFAILIQFIRRKPMRPILFITALSILVATPWIIRNTLLENKLTLTQKSALGTNLLYGTFTRKEFGQDIWNEALKRYKGCDNECAFELAIERIRNGIQDGSWFKARLEQYPRLIIDTGTSLAPEFANGPVLYRLIYVLLQLAGLILAIVGLKNQPIQVWLTPAFLLLFHLPLWIEARYFLPAAPFMSILTAAGMVKIYDHHIKPSTARFGF